MAFCAHSIPYIMLALLVVQLSLKIKPAVNSLNLFTIIISVNVHLYSLYRYGILAGSLRSRREGFTLSKNTSIFLGSFTIRK